MEVSSGVKCDHDESKYLSMYVRKMYVLICMFYVRNKVIMSKTTNHIECDFKFERTETATSVTIGKNPCPHHPSVWNLLTTFNPAIFYNPLKILTKPLKWLHNSM